MPRGEIGRGVGGHHRAFRGENDEWLTPPEIVQALGEFDLDPCAAADQPWATAYHHYTIADDGLAQPWEPDEFVWCNPPYGPQTWKWLARLAEHPAGGIALTFARTETAGFFAEAWGKASSMLFIKGRLYFYRIDGSRAAANSGGPSVLLGYGDEATRRLEKVQADKTIEGALVRAGFFDFQRGDNDERGN